MLNFLEVRSGFADTRDQTCWLPKMCNLLSLSLSLLQHNSFEGLELALSYVNGLARQLCMAEHLFSQIVKHCLCVWLIAPCMCTFVMQSLLVVLDDTKIWLCHPIS